MIKQKAARKAAKKASKKSSARPGARTAKTAAAKNGSASKRIDQRTRELGDWRGQTLERMRRIIVTAAPEAVEEWKWAKATSPGVPVWSQNGIICTGETYKDKVKLTFAKGASLKDPSGLFNSSLDGGTRRAIDIREADTVDEAALRKLIQAAVALNLEGSSRRR